MKTIQLLVLALFLGLSNLSAQQGNCPALDMPKEAISDSEKASLLYMFEEEKLAGDVYETLNEKWNLRIFSNIMNAEDNHQSMVAALLDKYGIDYVKTDERGKFESADLQKLYTNLVNEGLQSVEQALQVGATIEDMDIFDLENALKNAVDNKDISFVYSNLMRGSENHMRAFTRWLRGHNINYEAQYIGPERLQEIIQR